MNNEKLARFVRDNLPHVLDAINHAQNEGAGQSGATKLDLAVDYLNGLIDIPVLPEAIERMILKAAITGVVELAKRAWGDTEWFEKLNALLA